MKHPRWADHATRRLRRYGDHMMKGRPPWKDEAGVRKLVGQIIEHALDVNNVIRIEEANKRSASEWWDIFQSMALASANHGEFGLLAEMMDPQTAHPLIGWLRDEGFNLDMAQVAATLRGERGQPSAKIKTEAERRALTPTHDAHDEVVAIEVILRLYYPEQRRGVRELAVEIASARTGVPVGTLIEYGRKIKKRGPTVPRAPRKPKKGGSRKPPS